MATLFISDLHLGAEQPHISDLFITFLEHQALEAEALYILGDFFEYWIGDDAILPEHQPALEALQAYTRRGIPTFIMHGNRDFLLGDGFMEMTGCRLLPDPSVIDLYGQPSLLTHGDSLCSDDLPYLEFRSRVRDPQWQRDFLAKPVKEREHFARQARQESKRLAADKSEAIMDVNQQAVVQMMQRYRVKLLIHGHTHRPDIHELCVDDQPARRIVLSDWGTHGNYLVIDDSDCRLEYFS